MKKLSLSLLVCFLVSSCSFKNVDNEPRNEYYIADFSTPKKVKIKNKKGEQDKHQKKGESWYRYVRFDKKSKLKTNPVQQVAKVKKRHVVTVPKEGKGESVKTKAHGWVFNTKAKYTVQYTSTPTKKLAEKLKNKLEIEMGEQAHLYTVRHKQQEYFVVFAGEYFEYERASEVAKPKNGWVRKLSVVRNNRCKSKKFLEQRGISVGGYCE